MLSFRYDLTAGQVRLLLDTYAGNNLPTRRLSSDDMTKQIHDAKVLGLAVGTVSSHFLTIVQKLVEKGLVVHVNGTKTHHPGWACTNKGKTIATLIIEDAERIIEAGQWAKKRKLA